MISAALAHDLKHPRPRPGFSQSLDFLGCLEVFAIFQPGLAGALEF